MKRLFLILGSVAFAVAAGAFASAQSYPTPPPAATLPAPAPSASASIQLGKAKATPAPPKDRSVQRVGVSGVWEIQIQRLTGVTYTHFKITQKDNVLTGEYLDTDGKKFPLFGSIDGKTVRVVVSLPNGGTLVFNGTEDAFTDMMGMLALSGDSVPFTAAYRPKYNWLDNLTPGAGGMGGIP